MFQTMKRWFILRKICKLFGYHFTFKQKRLIISSKRPMGLGLWKRGSGKTTAACLWTLLHWPEPIYIEREISSYPNKTFLVPDPDLAGIKRRAQFTGQKLAEISNRCNQAGIPVAKVYGFHYSDCRRQIH